MFYPREEQQEVLNYSGGTMGVSAVPGAGKTATLSALAADLVTKTISQQTFDTYDEPEHEVLIVTFSNAAEMVFSTRIASILEERGAVPGYGYRVRTLHGMALEMLSGHSLELGIPDDFVVLDDIQAGELMRQAVALWAKEDNGELFDLIAKPNLTPDARVNFLNKDWQSDMSEIAKNVISKAKDYRLTPEALRAATENIKDPFGRKILEAVCRIYENYQTKLRNYPAMDFSDLMLNTYRLLNTDRDYLELLQNRYSYILEDEAQDSTCIQEDILRLLTEKNGNWVRVGDPNQAINKSFTTSSPELFKKFLNEAGKRVDLKTAGRSQLSVIRQANHLIKLVSETYRDPKCRESLSLPNIFPTKPGDLQGNPADCPDRVVYDMTPYMPSEEIESVCRAAAEHVHKYPKETAVILVPTNLDGMKMVKRLSEYPVEVIEILKSTERALDTAAIISAALRWLSTPFKKDSLLRLFNAIFNEKAEGEYYISPEESTLANSILSEIRQREDFFYPLDEDEFEKMISEWNINELLIMTLFRFRRFLTRWLEARFLPIDQLVLLISQDLFDDADNLCCAAQIGSQLRNMSRENISYNLNDFAVKTEEIAAKSKLHAGLHGAEKEYDPNRHPGKIAVTTYHSAKGLEWDQVFAANVNNFSFPDINDAQSRLIKGSKYMNGYLNLQDEMILALKAAAFPETGLEYKKALGTQYARHDYVCERLRLLYVGITRAKKGLHVSWNKGKWGNNKPPYVLKMLSEKWAERMKGGVNA